MSLDVWDEWLPFDTWSYQGKAGGSVAEQSSRINSLLVFLWLGASLGCPARVPGLRPGALPPRASSRAF